MVNLSIIDIPLNSVTNIYIKMKTITSKLHNTSASIAFIKKALFVDVIPKFAISRYFWEILFSVGGLGEESPGNLKRYNYDLQRIIFSFKHIYECHR